MKSEVYGNHSGAIKSGYLYVLTHPSDPTLIKIGQTTRDPKKRLAQHNSKHAKYTSQIVKETGQKWELKKYIPVPDPVHAENVFWETAFPGPFSRPKGIEVFNIIDMERVELGLEAAKKAGKRQPEPLPDWVYSYTRWMRKRLEGRDITLVGLVKSMVSGNANFQCSNGHEWRTRCLPVAEGEGCPKCGIGYREPEEIWEAAKFGFVCLLINPSKPGFIKIGLMYKTREQPYAEDIWEDWEIHRHRFSEDPVLAEKIIWKLLGRPLPHDREPIEIDLSLAEQAFRDLIPQMHREIALEEKKNSSD